MKVTFKGTGLTPELAAQSMREMEDEYGLRVRSLTAYIRFEDENDRIVEPVVDGNPIEREFVFTVTKEVKKPVEYDDVQILGFNETLEITEEMLDQELDEADRHRVQMIVDKYDFTEHDIRKALGIMIANVDRFSVGYLKSVLKHQIKQNKVKKS